MGRWLTWVCLAVGLTRGGFVWADEGTKALGAIIELNERALADFRLVHPAEACEKLENAITLGKRAKLETHKMMARTYLHLGAITILGLRDQAAGERHLRKALQIRPDIRLGAAVSTPELEALLGVLRGAPAPVAAAPLSDPPTPAAQPASAAATPTQVAEAALDALLRAAPKQDGSVPSPPPIAPIETPAAAPPSDRAVARPVAAVPRRHAAMSDDNPLAAVDLSRRLEQAAALTHRRGEGQLFAGLGIGTGYGWHGGGALELRRDLVVAQGLNSSGDLQLVPEFGFQIRDTVALSLQIRLQFIAARGSGETRPGTPANGAVAVLARVHKTFGDGNTQFLLSGAVGAGDAFRLVVPPRDKSGLLRHDTVRGGPFVLGPGCGVIHHFTRTVAGVAELRTLVGVPTVAVAVDVNAGLQLAF